MASRQDSGPKGFSLHLLSPVQDARVPKEIVLDHGLHPRYVVGRSAADMWVEGREGLRLTAVVPLQMRGLSAHPADGVSSARNAGLR
jgi:hypothetical protein